VHKEGPEEHVLQFDGQAMQSLPIRTYMLLQLVQLVEFPLQVKQLLVHKEQIPEAMTYPELHSVQVVAFVHAEHPAGQIVQFVPER